MSRPRARKTTPVGRAPARRSQARAARVGARPRAGARSEAAEDPAVVALLHALDHPRKQDIEAVRRIVLGASPKIREGVKWNAPSFRTEEYFATIHLRSTEQVQLVLHRGAKVKDDSTDGMRIEDPLGMVRWLAKERCLVTVGRGAEIEERKAALQKILRAWIRQL